MLVITALIGFLMLLSSRSRRRMVAVALIGCLAIFAVAPPPAQAQAGCLSGDMLCYINLVLTTINQVVNGWLNSINTIRTTVLRMYQQTVWPVNLINQAKNQIVGMIGQFRGVMQGIMSINPHTATLANPVALENILRDRSTGNLGSLSQIYTNTYRPVPQAGKIAPEDRNMTDMDDALAQDNLKTLKMSDQAQDLMLQAADQIENIASTSAPGSAPFLTASSAVANIKSQAVMQKMLAALLRQEAARVAHDNALRKRRSALAVQLQTDMSKVLKHQ